MTLSRLLVLLLALQSLAAIASDAPVVFQIPGGPAVRIVKCYPEGKMRASCQSFDDGTLGSDWPVLDALRKRRLPATFFLNSLNPSSKDAIKYPKRYDGFEIASHGANHKGLDRMTPDQVRAEIESDQKILGEAFGQVIDGFAYPYGAVPKEEPAQKALEDQLSGMGLIYARRCGATGAYAPPADFMRWVPDCGFFDPIAKFLALPADETLRVRMCFTHSIDFARGLIPFDKWELILDQLAAEPGIWNTTMRDFTRYMLALRALGISDAGLKNDAPISVWVRVDDKLVQVPAHTTLAWGALPGSK